jgi:heterodisulfide reductase subunit C
MDLSLGDIIRAAIQNNPKALSNKSLWNCDSLIKSNPICPSGLNRKRVVKALREEAIRRGYKDVDK